MFSVAEILLENLAVSPGSNWVSKHHKYRIAIHSVEHRWQCELFFFFFCQAGSVFSDFCLSFAVYLYYYFGHHFVEFNCRAGLETHCGLVVPCDEVLIYCGSANRQLQRHGCRSSSSFEYRRRRTTVVKAAEWWVLSLPPSQDLCSLAAVATAASLVTVTVVTPVTADPDRSGRDVEFRVSAERKPDELKFSAGK